MKRLLLSMGWMATGRLVCTVFGLLNTVMLSRHLGIERYGHYLMALTFVSFFVPLCDGGTKAVVLKEAGLFPERRSGLAGAMVLLNLSLALLSMLLCWAALLAVGYPDLLKWAIFVMSFDLILSRMLCFEPFLTAQGAFKSLSLIRMASSLGLFFCNAMVVLTGAGFAHLLWTFLIGNVVLGLGLLHWVVGRVSWSFEGASSRAKVLLKEGWPLCLSAWVSILYLSLDLLLLSKFCPMEVVSHYGLAVKLAVIFYVFGETAVEVIFPHLSQAFKRGEDYFRKTWLRQMLLLAVLALTLILVTTVFAEFAVLLVFGEAFQATVPVLRCLVWSCLPVFCLLILRTVVAFYGKNVPVLRWSLEGLGLNLALNMVLIPSMGAMGAALATLVSDGYVLWRAWVLLRGVFRKN
jgi:PST family polysaccharide transporter